MERSSGITYLAKTTLKGEEVTFGIKDRDRLEHLAVLGRASSVRAGMLAQVALEDIGRDIGTLIVDATGELAQLVSERMTGEAKEKVILLDPSDSDHPFSWNPLLEYTHLPPAEAVMFLSEALGSIYRIPSSPLTEFAARTSLKQPDASVLLLYELVT